MDFELGDSAVPFHSPSGEARREKAKEFRRRQLEQYQVWSLAANGESVHSNSIRSDGKDTRTSRGKSVKNSVTFMAKDRLRDAVSRSDVNEVESVLTSGSGSVDVISEASGVSLLHTCCVNEDIEGVRLLLRHGAKVNIQDNDLWTPLHVAAACDNAELVELLLEHGADACALDVDGNFPSDNADDPKILGMILRHLETQGVRERDLAGVRCQQAKDLIMAVDESILREEPVDRHNKNGVAFLHIAAANGYCEVIKLLLDAGADINIQDDLGYTPIHLATKFNQVKAAKLLLKRKASTQVWSYNDELPIDLAENEEILRYLEFTGGGKKLKRIPSMLKSHPYLFPAVAFPLGTAAVDVLGPPSPAMRRQSMLSSRTRMHTVDLGDFERERTRSKPKDWKLKPPLAKLEEVYESSTLEEKDTFDEGSDLSIQGPILDKLKGSLLKRRQSEQLLLPDAMETDNLASLPDLTKEVLLEFLQQRYSKNQIYTHIGEILVAVNPFKQLDYYSEKVSEQYSSDPPDLTLPPHIYAVANQVYRSMRRSKAPQCCVISGESGAGKTETCKLIVQQLLFLTESEEMELNIKIEQVNPILETFGNAQTVMNDNSSRFGKYLELIFSEEGKLLGATYKEYLLEKLRVVVQASRERNFHIFYLMFAGLDQKRKEKFKWKDLSSHRCVSGSDCNISEERLAVMADQFQEVKDSLHAVGFTDQDESELLEALAAVLHICDVTFVSSEDENTDSSEPGGTRISSPTHIETIAELLQVESDDLVSCLTTETIYTRGEAIVRGRTEVQAMDCRDALAKALYGRMFSWIVNGINHHLKPEDVEDNHCQKIGLLDIFGFEKFEHNSFEQMCINIANEQLQFFFNQHIFQWELEECSKEGVALPVVSFTSNAPILDMFLDRGAGLLALLDEESRFPRGSDTSLALKLHQGMGSKGGGVYRAPPNKGTSFGVAHYAGYVEYDMTGFLEKNRDSLSPAVSSLMRSSSSVLVREIFGEKLTRTGSVAASLRQSRSRREESPFAGFNMKASRRMSKMMKGVTFPRRQPKSTDTAKRKAPTVANHFKNSLKELMDKMNASQPHFVRCIKPNPVKQPMNFDPTYVQTQLRCTGVMETTRIRKCGYPTRIKFEDFLKRYPMLEAVYAPPTSVVPASEKEKCCSILSHVGIEGWACGRSKVMLKFSHSAMLDAQCSMVIINVIVMQRYIRAWLSRRRRQRLKEARERRKQQLLDFFGGIADTSHKCFRKLVLLNRLDTKNYFRKKKELEEKEKLESKLREEEIKRRREEEEEEEQKQRESKERELRERELREFKEDKEEMDKKYKGETAAVSRTRESLKENLKRSSAVVSGTQAAAARKKKSAEGRSSGPGAHASNNGHLSSRGDGTKLSEVSQSNGSSGNVGRRDRGHPSDDQLRGPTGHYQNDFVAINYFNTVEDSSQAYHKPLTETFEPVSIGLKKPQRRLMKIRSNPLTDSDGIMVVSAESSGDLQLQGPQSFPSNGYETSKWPVVQNGHGLGGLDDVMVINVGPLPAVKSFTDGNHLQNKIVLNDDDGDDYDDTVSPMAGDLVEEIYDDNTIVPQSKGLENGLTPASSADNIYDEVDSTNLNAEKFPSLSPSNYCEPVAMQQHAPLPDFQQTPGRYLDPSCIMAQPPVFLTPEEKRLLECGDSKPNTSTAKEREDAKRRISPVQSQGETSCANNELYENLRNIKIDQDEHASHKINQKSYYTGISPLDDEDYGDTPSVPPSLRKHPKSPVSPRTPKSHHRNTSLDGDVFLPGPQLSPQSRTCHNNAPQRRAGTKLKKSQSSSFGDSATIEPAVSSESPSAANEGLKNGEVKTKSTAAGSPKKQARKEMKKSLSGSQDSLDEDVANKKAKSPRSPRKFARREMKRSQSEPEDALNEVFQNDDSGVKSPAGVKKRAHKNMKKCRSESDEVKAISPKALIKRAQNRLKKSADSTSLLFSPHAPLPPIPSEDIPLEAPHTEEPSPYSVPGEITKRDGADTGASDYAYIGSNTLQKAFNEADSMASPYLQFQPRKISPTASPQPYTPPIARKNKTHAKLSRSVALSDQPPLPARPSVPSQSNPNNSSLEQNISSRLPALPPAVLSDRRLPALPPVVLSDRRPPALPPVVLSDRRPPAPLPPEAAEVSHHSKQHQPLSYSKSLYTQESSTPSGSSANNRQHVVLSRNVSASVLSSVPESKSESSSVINQRLSDSSSNNSPLIPPRFRHKHAPPPSAPPSFAVPQSFRSIGDSATAASRAGVNVAKRTQNGSEEQGPGLKDSPPPSDKLKATSDPVKLSSKPLTSATVSSTESATKPQTSSPSSSASPGNSSMPQWKRALLEKKKQQQQQPKSAGGKFKQDEVTDGIPEWKKALLEKKSKGQHRQ